MIPVGHLPSHRPRFEYRPPTRSGRRHTATCSRHGDTVWSGIGTPSAFGISLYALKASYSTRFPSCGSFSIYSSTYSAALPSQSIMPSVLLLLAATLSTFILTMSYRRMKRYGPQPPGPKPIPVIGNVLNLTARELWLKATEWAESYGAYIVCSDTRCGLGLTHARGECR